jgi:uncharacterized protein
MRISVDELEREPIDFSVALPQEAIGYGDEATQIGNLAAEGRAEVLHEHRGPKEIVSDIRLKGSFSGLFEVPCARCVEPVELREQVLLSLPARTLCQQDCKGLCPRCGENRNQTECSCEQGPSDPRWEALAGLSSRIKN